MRFSKFSNEIKFDIFATFSAWHLCSIVAKVCREWRQFAYTPILWTDISLEGSFQTVSQMKLILQRCVRVRELNLNFIDDIAALTLTDFSVRKSLRILRLCRCNTINTETIDKLTTIFPFVELLNDYSSIRIDDSIAKSIGRWKYLKTIQMRSHVSDESTYLALIGKYCCANLNNLFAISAEDLTDRSVEEFIVGRCRSLHYLRLGKLYNLGSGVYKLLSQCRRLVGLTLYQSKNLTDECFVNILQLTELKILQISYCEKLFDEGFSSLISSVNFSTIEQMEITYCPNLSQSDLNYIAKKSNLRELTVSLTNFLTMENCETFAIEYGFKVVDVIAFLDNVRGVTLSRHNKIDEK